MKRHLVSRRWRRPRGVAVVRRWAVVVLVVLTTVATLATAAVAVVSQTPEATDSPDHPVGPKGRVNAIVRLGGRIYIGGDFTSVGGKSRAYLAAINRNTGVVDATWTPTADGPVDALAVAPDGSVIYVGGRFKTIDGKSRKRLAALDPVTGAPTAWNPKADQKVRALVATEDVIFAGGNFSTIGGQPVEHFAAIDAGDGGLVPGWSIPVDGKVLDLELAGDGTLYLGGKFTRVDDKWRPYLAAVDMPTASVTDYRTAADFEVFDMALSADENTIYAAMGGSGAAGGNVAAAYRTSNGTTRWFHTADGDFQAVAEGSDKVYFGGHFAWLGDRHRPRMVAMDPASGVISGWNPGMDSGLGVWALRYDNNRLLIGGDFSKINGTSQPHFAVMMESDKAPPTAEYVWDCNFTDCDFDATASQDEDGTIVSYTWDFDDGASAQGANPKPKHLYAAPGTYRASLTVKDDDGETDQIAHDVTAGTGGPIAFKAARSKERVGARVKIKVPPSVKKGDALLLFASVNGKGFPIYRPKGVTGWKKLDSVTAAGIKAKGWSKVARTADAGSFVKVVIPEVHHLNVVLLVYRGTDDTKPVAAVEAVKTPRKWRHTTPTARVNKTHSWLVSYWSAVPGWARTWESPGGEVDRGLAGADKGGEVAAIATDAGAGHPTGDYGGKEANLGAPAKATAWTVVLKPG